MWNFCMLHQCCIMYKLTQEFACYRWEFVKLLEAWQTGFRETTILNGYKLWFSSDKSKHEHSVGFLIRKTVVRAVHNRSLISNRLISSALLPSPTDVIQMNASTFIHGNEEVKLFYKQLEKAVTEVPNKNILSKVSPDAHQKCSWPRPKRFSGVQIWRNNSRSHRK